MNILILGYSNLVRRKVINVLIKKGVKFSIASKSFRKKEDISCTWYRNYHTGLNRTSAKIVYISLPNSKHYYWAKKSLLKNFHVIVDKPLCEIIIQTKELLKIARKKNKLLSESIFFNYHEQIYKIMSLAGKIKKIVYVNAKFVIPMPNRNSLLLSKKFSGGALMDMGPYAAAISRLFCNGKLLSINKIFNKNKKGLITSFLILCKFENTIFSGFFSFNGPYQNNLALFTNHKKIEINRVFSPPTNKKLKIKITKKNNFKYIDVKKDNPFENYLSKILNNIKKKKFEKFYKMVLKDIEFRDKLIK